MKKLMMTVALLLLPLSGFAQDLSQELPEQQKPPLTYWASKPIQCSTPEEIVELMKKYGETPAIVFEGSAALPNGVQSPSRFVVAMNPKTETWTLLEFTGPTQACILGAGTGKVSLGGKKTEIAT